MCTFSRFLVLLLISSLCGGGGVVLARTNSKGKFLNETSPQYLLISSTKENVSSDVCVIKIEKNITSATTGQANLTSINCSDVVGATFPLNLTQDNFLYVRKSNQYIAPGQYCLTTRNTAKKCPSQSSSFTWNKCCPQNQALNATSNSCVTFAAPLRLTINHEKSSFSVLDNFQDGFTCAAGYSWRKFSTGSCASQSHTRFRITQNGAIQYEASAGIYLRKSEWRTLDPSSNLYCMDQDSVGVTNPASNCHSSLVRNFQQEEQRLDDDGNDVEINESISWPNWDDDEDSSIGSLFYSNCGSGSDGENLQRQEITIILFACVQDDHIISPEPSSENISTKAYILAFIWLVTIPLLLGSALVNCYIIQKNIHGWILTGYLLSMCVLNVLSAIFIMEVGRGRKQTEKYCQPIDFMMKHMYLSTLCWMSSINFGLHKTFRYTLRRPVGYRRFVTSVIFSLGFPTISVTVSYYAAHFSVDPNCDELNYCILYSHSTIPFYTVPMFLLVLGNFAIFLKTSCTITRLRREAGDVLQRQEDHIKSFSLFGKLFLLTGCIWLIRLVLFVLQIKGAYFKWYGVLLETVYSIPEVVFPIIVFHHPEFIKWCWNKVPVVSSLIFKFNPLFNVPATK